MPETISRATPRAVPHFSVFSWQDVLNKRVVPAGAKTALTVGVFDGPHIGHMELLDTVLGAREQGLGGRDEGLGSRDEGAGSSQLRSAFTSGCDTSAPTGASSPTLTHISRQDKPAPSQLPTPNSQLPTHPALAGAVTFAGMDIPLISTVAQRVDFFQKKGLDFVIVIDFSRDFSKMEGREFISFLVSNCGMAFLCEGDDFRCGHKGSCDVREIERLSRELAFAFAVKESVICRGRKVSSSRIRDDVREGRFDAAREMLGRPYSLDLRGAEKNFWQRVAGGTEGSVGIAALNKQFPQILPKPGAYNVTAVAGGERREAAMTVLESETVIHGQGTPVTEIIFAHESQ